MIETPNNTQKPLYQQIREDLLLNFRNTGDAQLPSEREICKRYGVCRPTVHKALSYLVENDIVVRRPGKGSFFRSREEAHSQVACGVKLVIRRDWKDWSSDNYFGMIVQGICSALNEFNTSLTIEQFRDNLLLDLLPETAPATIWLSPEGAEQEVIRTLADAGRPVTVINRLLRYPNINVISGDHVGDGETVARFAEKRGSQRMLFFLQESDSGLAKSREEGIRNVLGDTVPFRRISLPPDGLAEAMESAVGELHGEFGDNALILLNSKALLKSALKCFPMPENILLFADNTEPLLHGINLLVIPVVEIGRLAGRTAATGQKESSRILLPGKLYS